MIFSCQTGFDHKMKIPQTESPLNIYATSGDRSGEIDLIWDPVKYAAAYVIQMQCGRESSKWKVVDLVTRSSYTAGGLKSGRVYRFRVAPMKNKANKTWSQQVKIKAP